MLAVVLSALLHALWNYLLRRAGGEMRIAALGIVAEGALLVPLAAVTWYSSGGPPLLPFLGATVIGAALALANYEALMAAYRRADMSLVYPVARGGVFLFLPLLGFIVFGERLDAHGWLSVALIVTGIMLLPLARFDRTALREMARQFRDRVTVLALLAAASTAAYTVWDKYAIGFLDTILYFSGYTILLALWFAAVLARAPRGEVRGILRTHGRTIVVIGLFIASSYLLVLVALRSGVTTQVLAVRQLSIPIGVALGWRFLRESVTGPRVTGSVLITTGCLIAALI